MFGVAKTVVSFERGCQNHTFTETGISSILGFILEVILEAKTIPKWKCGSLWGSGGGKWGSLLAGWLAGRWLAGWPQGFQELREYAQVMVTGLSPGVW